MPETEGESPSSSLSSVFESSDTPVSNDTSVPDDKTTEHKEEPATEDKKSDSSDSSQKQQVPVVEGDEKQTDDKSKMPDEKPADQKVEKKEPASEDKKDKWESEENPFVKRYKDTAANWQKEHQEKLQLQGQVQQLAQEVTVLKKIADGTYDPQKDDPSLQVRPEDVAAQALNVGKMLSSKHAAVAQFGEESVMQRLTEFNELFGQNQIVQDIVTGSDSPVSEAFFILDRYHFEKKYGARPDDIYKNIRTEVEKEIEPEIRKKVTAEIMERFDKKKDTPRGLPPRGSSGVKESQNSDGAKFTPLKNVFN